jgi:hypothetical protein
MSDDADTILKQQAELADKRTNWDTFWQRIAERVLPNSATITVQGNEGEPRTDRLFDSTAVIANERFSAWIGEAYTPRDQVWHGMEPEDRDLKEDHEVKQYFEQNVETLFSVRYRPYGNFTSQRQDCYTSLGAFGNHCMLIDEAIGEGIRYKSIFIAEVYWAENHQGIIDTVYRKFQLSGRNAIKKFPRLAGKTRKDAEDNPHRMFDFVHAVFPNGEMKGLAPGWQGMPFCAYYIDVAQKSVIERGGYRSFPYAIGRFMKGPNETYARSPAMTAFPSIMTLNEQKKTVLKAGQMAVAPPILLMEEGVMEAFDARSNALNYGALSSDGQELAKPFNNNAKIDMGIELMALEQKAVNDAFLVSLFQILSDHPQMTATEVLQRMEEKASLLSPTTGRLESEDAGPMIMRELDICARAGLLAPPPPQLIERGGDYKILYTSPLARARRAADALAITRGFEIGSLAAGLDPDAVLVMDVAAGYREVLEIGGVPAKVMRSKEDVAKMIAQKNQQRALATMAQAAPDVAGAAKDIAQAQQLRSQTQAGA